MNNRYNLNKNLAQMLKGGVIMDVTNVEQAKIAQEAGAVAVMALGHLYLLIYVVKVELLACQILK